MPRWTIRLAVFLWLSAVGSLFAQAQTDNPFSQAYRNRYGKLPNQPTAGDRMMANFLQSEGHPEFTQNLHFQSRPGLYCTANVYVPKNAPLPCPAILYVCGHAAVKENGISYGNKTHYQHHGAWFARNGYVCIVLDSVQLGEIEGIHHGTHRYDMWWWNSRGYTSAGVEAWNCIRALDYLQSRSDVDSSRLGVTGRSGGGAYSWWVAALDGRIKAVCPVAGITGWRCKVSDANSATIHVTRSDIGKQPSLGYGSVPVFAAINSPVHKLRGELTCRAIDDRNCLFYRDLRPQYPSVASAFSASPGPSGT